MNTKSLRMVVVALLTLVLGLAAAPMAQAADPGAIDPTAAGSLTLRTDETGVVFTVARIQGVDLTTPAGWQQAQAYAAAPATTAGHLDVAVVTPATGADGAATLAPLAVGLYLVHELGARTAGGAYTPVLGAPDFIVAIPTEVPDQPGVWSYAVDAHPKHERPTITKAVADGNAGVTGQDAPTAGHVLTYTFESSLPQRPVTGYRLVDDLGAQAQYLELAAPDWAGELTVALRGSGSTTTLRRCADTAATDCHYLAQVTTSRLEVRLTDAGVAQAVATRTADDRARLVTTVQTRVRAEVMGATDAGVLDLPNQVTLYPGEGRDPVPSNTVHSRYARFSLHKIDDASGASLSGAVFTLYRTEADARAARSPLAVGDPTGDDGMTWFRGLHVTDYQDDTVDDDAYWLVETTAPKGYTAGGQPIRVELRQDGTLVADGLGVDATGGVAVPNPRIPGVPRTGVVAQVLAVAAAAATSGPGSALLLTALGATAVGLVVARRRRRDT